MTPPVAFSTLACPDWSWQEILGHGTAFGYDGVEVRLLERETDLLSRPELAPAFREQRRRELESAGFQVCGLASSVTFDSPDAAERKRQIETGGRYLELAHALGASFIRVFGDVLPPDSDPVQRRAVLNQIADGLNRLGDLAEPTLIDVLIETHGDFADSRLLCDVLEQVSSPRVGVVWDTHHPWRYCGEPISETFARLAPWVRHTHWKDSKAPSLRERSVAEIEAEARARQLMSGHRPADFVVFGAGEFPAAESLRVLRAAGYAGWVSYEWEKAWHPEIAEPEVALPPFPEIVRKLWSSPQ
ncbi:MAG: sugar phosphate isomerase/epimerase [Planctomycetaceae bacterium]|nr:sugar phosphate isomerase/epimerase [Planctomycetaceae bacterium]